MSGGSRSKTDHPQNLAIAKLGLSTASNCGAALPLPPLPDKNNQPSMVELILSARALPIHRSGTFLWHSLIIDPQLSFIGFAVPL